MSVSRVGGAAQIKAMKTASGTLKRDLAQFRELEAFATFGSELDKVSAAQLDRGYRLTELLKQGLNSPMPVEEQVVSIFAGTGGYLDDVPVADVRRFEAELLECVRARHRDILDSIRDTGALPEGDELADAVNAFKEQFQATEAVEAVTAEDSRSRGGAPHFDPDAGRRRRRRAIPRESAREAPATSRLHRRATRRGASWCRNGAK